MATKAEGGGYCGTLLAYFGNSKGLLILVLTGKLELMAYRRPGQSVRRHIG